MRNRITLNTFRRLERAEEQMIRAAMPRTSASDAAPLASEINVPQVARRTWRAGSLVVKGAFTLAEVAHA